MTRITGDIDGLRRQHKHDFPAVAWNKPQKQRVALKCTKVDCGVMQIFPGMEAAIDVLVGSCELMEDIVTGVGE